MQSTKCAPGGPPFGRPSGPAAIFLGRETELSNAQDEAFAQLACERKLLTAEMVERARVQRRREALEGPLAQVLVDLGLISPNLVAEVLRELARGRFACDRCANTCAYDALARLDRLECTGCGAPLGREPSALRAAPPSTRGLPAVARSELAGPPSSRRGLPAVPPPPRTGAAPAVAPPPDDPLRQTVVDDTVIPDPLRQTVVDDTVIPGPPSARPRGPRRRMGRYTLIRELARGSHGIVFLAKREGLERQFAVKVLLDGGLDPDSLQRFKLEAAVASKLDDPGVVGVFDIGQDGLQWYYAMEYVEGETLRQRLKRGPLDPHEAARLLLQLTQTLQLAHEQGVIHRDLKPANIIIDASDGRPRITDFGLARDRTLAKSLTQSGDILGTPYYMAPEQIRGNKDIDHRVDVYTVGVLLYECLTGRRPYQAKTPFELIEKVCHVVPPSPRTLVPSIPTTLERVCLRALEKDPDQRCPTAGDLASELERFLVESGERIRPRPRTQARRRPSVPLVGGLVALGLALLGVLSVLAIADQREAFRQSVRAELTRLAESARTQPRSQIEVALARLQTQAAADAELLAEVEGLGRRLEATARLERATAFLAERPPDLAGAERELARAQELAGDDPGFGPRLEEAAGLLQAHRALAAVLPRARALEPYSEQVVSGFAAARELAAADPELAARIALERLRYLRRRGRDQVVLAQARGLETAPGEIGLSARFLRASSLRALGRTDDAVLVLNDLYEQNPGSPIGLAAGAAAAMFSGQIAEAGRRLDRALDVRSDSIEALLVALFVESNRRPKQLKEFMDRVAEVAPDHPQVWELRAVLAIQEGRPADALQAAQVLERLLAPAGTALVQELRVHAHLSERDTQQAQRELDAFLERHSDDATAWFLQGVVHMRNSDRVAARTAWRRSDQLDRRTFEAELRQVGNPRLRREIERAVRSEEDEPFMPGGAGQSAEGGVLMLGRLPRSAELALSERVAAAPAAAQEALTQALQAAARGRPWDEIAPHVTRAMELAPGSEAVALERARLLVGRDVYDEGLEAIAAARELAPSAAHELARLEAEVWRRRGALDAARERYAAAAAADPDGPEGACARAEELFLTEDVGQAERIVRETLAAWPEHTASRVLLAVILAGTERARRALPVVREVLDREGAINSRVVLARCFARIVLMMRQPAGGGWEGVLLENQQLLNLTRGAGPRLLFSRITLTFDALPRSLYRWTAERLFEARQAEPERAETYELLGVLALRSGQAAGDVAADWTQARALKPEYRFRQWRRLVERAYRGIPAELAELLE